MKRKFLILFPVLLLVFDTINCQKFLTLRECYERAYEVNPLANEGDTYTEMWKLKDNNLSKGWFPTIDANASFLYNSSVVDLENMFGSLPVPGIASSIPAMPHDQYKITLDINQMIFDGGAIRSMKNLEKADLKINQKQSEADMYKLRGLINNYYFSILLLVKQKGLLNNYLELINKRILSLQSAFKNGVLTRSDIDVMKSEKIKIAQQLQENEVLKASLLKILSGLTGLQIDDTTQLLLPLTPIKTSNELSRPELELFDLRTEQLVAGQKLTESRRIPKAFAFATLGYGNPPGSNFFKDEFASYYVVGGGIKWNIFDWNKTKNEKNLIGLQQSILEKRKSDLEENLGRLLESKNAEILNLNSILASDTTLVEIRKRITASAESQYENGTITATELLNEMNSERQAIINYEIHKINLEKAKIEYLNISGKEIE